MAPLPTFSLPLPQDGPPHGYGWEGRDTMSVFSSTSAFSTAVNQRDTFLGKRCCMICGESSQVILQHCRIILESEPDVWVDLKDRRWIPRHAKGSPEHEPRNGLVMCLNHRSLFNKYSFFLRFVPEVRKFVFVNHSTGNSPSLVPYHGKGIAIDINDRHAPFPSVFIIHEMRVRGFHPFQPTEPDIDMNNIKWQDWVYSSGVFDDSTNSFKRKRQKTSLADNPAAVGSIQPPFNVTTTNPPGASSGTRKLTLDDNTINEILFATRNSASWKACQMEGTSWAGTADENIQKYITSIGVEELSPSIDPQHPTRSSSTTHNDD